MTADKAKCYPPALRTVLPNVEHRTSNDLNTGLDRDHQHLKGRLQSVRWFKVVGGAINFSQGHALIRNLRGGFSMLTTSVERHLRLARAWSVLCASL